MPKINLNRSEKIISGSALALVVILAGMSAMVARSPAAYLLPDTLHAALVSTTPARAVSSPFKYTFNSAGTLNEAGSMDTSSSPYFWLNSGGQLVVQDGIGKTIQGALAKNSFWQLLYGKTNPLDTSAGYFPQNLFRLVTRSSWGNVAQETRFQITNTNLTDSPNRDGWSGVLLMSRYKDGNNLYYAGVRMDGSAVIKKKYKGSYTTLAQGQIWTGDDAYNRTSNPNLIPEKKWMRLKTRTVTGANNAVTVELYLDEEDDGTYKKILSAVDTNGGLTGAAHAGIRTDFMDVVFDDYTLIEEK